MASSLNLSQQLSECYYDTYHSSYGLVKNYSITDTAASIRNPFQTPIVHNEHTYYQLIISKQDKLINSLKRNHSSKVRLLQSQVQTLVSYLTSLYAMSPAATNPTKNESTESGWQHMHRHIMDRLATMKTEATQYLAFNNQLLNETTQLRREISIYEQVKAQLQSSLQSNKANQQRLKKTVDQLNEKVKNLQVTVASKPTVAAVTPKSTIPVFVSSHKQKKISVVVERVVEKIVQKVVEKSVDRIVEKVVRVEKPVYIKETVPVFVEVEVPIVIERVIEKVVEKIVEKPVIVPAKKAQRKEKIVYIEKPVFVDREIQKIVYRDKIEKVVQPIFIDREVEKVVFVKPVDGSNGLQYLRVHSQ